MSRYLIVKMSALGDVVQTMYTARFIREVDKDAHISWVIEEKFKDLLVCNDLVDTVISIDTKKARKGLSINFKYVKEFLKNFRKDSYDVVLDFQGNCKSGFFTLLSKGKQKYGGDWGFVSEWPNLLTTHKKIKVKHSNAMLLNYLQMTACALKQNGSSNQWVLKNQKTSLDSNYEIKNIMFCIGSNWPNKRMSVTFWIKFIKEVMLHFDVKVFFVWSSDDEKNTLLEIQEAVRSDSVVILDKMDISAWDKKISDMDLVVSVDSAALHLAGFNDVPTFSIFGPSSPSVYKPFGNMHVSYQGTCPFGVSFVKRCPHLRSCPDSGCSKDLDPARVFSKFAKSFGKYCLSYKLR